MIKLDALEVWNAVTALSHYSVAWTSVVTCQVKYLTVTSRLRSKVKLNFGVIKKVMATSNDLVTFWGHELGQTDHKGYVDLWGQKVRNSDLWVIK